VHSAFPGGGCVGNIVITKSVTIVGVGENDGNAVDDSYRGPPRSGNPITAVVDGCISIWGPGRPRVTLRDIEILGTTSGYVKDCNPVPTVNEGTTGLTPPRQRAGEKSLHRVDDRRRHVRRLERQRSLRRARLLRGAQRRRNHRRQFRSAPGL